MKGLRISALGIALGALAVASQAQTGGSVAICPWQFNDGNVTSRTMVTDTLAKILEHNGYTVLTQGTVEDSYRAMAPGMRMRHGLPDVGDLGKYSTSVGAGRLVYGTTSWHTRSIWVGTGPKTISTADVDLYIYGVKSGKIVYQRHAQGRSDERESVLKDVGDVLLTPLITVVSGGPATPREQRAAQIAIARAIRPWIRRHDQPK